MLACIVKHTILFFYFIIVTCCLVMPLIAFGLLPAVSYTTAALALSPVSKSYLIHPQPQLPGNKKTLFTAGKQ